VAREAAGLAADETGEAPAYGGLGGGARETSRQIRRSKEGSSMTVKNKTGVFDGFPYISTRTAGAMYHVILLANAPAAELRALAERQAQANQLPTCLVLAKDHAIYFGLDGRGVESDEPPRGGLIVAGHLVPAFECDASSEEFRTRQKKLEHVVARSSERGFAFGDLTKGGHPADDDERLRLEAFLPDGTPNGLSRCDTCGDWRGDCLDPSEEFAGQVMNVHCHCENRNRCARCNALLFERRLNANYYAPADRSIWHVPGFCGFRHPCPANTVAPNWL